MLDKDGDGEVDYEEFERWFSEPAGWHSSVHKQGKQLRKEANERALPELLALRCVTSLVTLEGREGNPL